MPRVVKDHNLLQTLTRVNRPYKKYKYGYVVDFADITSAFKDTNDNYFKELQGELGDEMANYTSLFKSAEEIDAEILEIKEKLFHFDAVNAEIFSQQVSQIKEKKDLLELIKVLSSAKELKNIIRLKGLDDQLDRLDFFKLNQLLSVAQARLNTLNLIDNITNESDTTNLLNSALEEIVFEFFKVSEEELILADQLRGQLKRTREALLFNFDQKDPEFISLREELERIFKKKNLGEVDQEDMRDNILVLQSIYDRVTELNRKNNLLKAKYEHDEKYARLHKRLVENKDISAKEVQIHQALINIKHETEEIIQNNKGILNNEQYFADELLGVVIKQFIDNQKVKIDYDTTASINNLLVKEYYRQYSYV